MANEEKKATLVAKKGNNVIFAGVFKGLKSSETKNGNVANLKMACKYYDKEEKSEKEEVITIAFWQSEKGFDPYKHITKKKLKDDQYMLVKGYIDKNDNVIGNLCLTGSGIMTLQKNPNDPEDKYDANVILGMAMAPRKNTYQGRDVTNLGVLTNLKLVDGSYSDGIANVSFWDSDNYAAATNAKKVIQGGDRIVVTTGEAGPVEDYVRKNGDPGHSQSFKGNPRFMIIGRKSDDKQQSKQPVAEPEPVAEAPDDFQPIAEDDLPEWMK